MCFSLLFFRLNSHLSKSSKSNNKFDFVIPKIIHCQELSENYRLKQRIILRDFSVCFLRKLVSLPSSTKNCSPRKFIYLLKFTYDRCRQCPYGYQRASWLSSLLPPVRGVWGLNSSLHACSWVPLLTSFLYILLYKVIKFLASCSPLCILENPETFCIWQLMSLVFLEWTWWHGGT